MTCRFFRAICGFLPVGVLSLALSAPAPAAAELLYRQMALKTIQCQKIPDKQRSRRCLQKASAPIHATCQKSVGQHRKACYQRLGARLRAAVATEIRNRRRP
ncbi:MAG: hypothetical protein RIB59_00435 [Rhodospirillales bacterium]